MTTQRPIRRALISVYDKTGLADLALGLADAGVEIVSTGSTAARIAELGVAVTPVSEVTGFPECLDGRVKTLHPHVHAGILADLRNPDHRRQLAELGVDPFDLVIVNLYPFRETVAAIAANADGERASDAAAEQIIEQIDIGGPAMVRAAAKNHANVATIVDPADYPAVLAAAHHGFDLVARRRLAAKAFAHTAAYDVAVASWFGHELTAEQEGEWPPFVGLALERAEILRYGENPHQHAALYVDVNAPGHQGAEPGAVRSAAAAGDGAAAKAPAPSGIAFAEQLHGKPMSYNNYVDADAAYRSVYDFTEPAVAIIKHTNPCGIAVGADVAEAHRKAHACDSVSAYGGVIAVNRPVSAAMAEQVAKIFTEVIIAPSYEDGAREMLMQRPSVRLLTAGPRANAGVELRPISGGVLAQSADALSAQGDDPSQWRLVAGEAVDEATLSDLAFAWRATRSVKSNAILLAANGATVGIGMGQVNRVDSARLAVSRAGERAAGSAAASDAFFPFADGLEVLIEAGVRAVVQPGGSVRDEDVIAAAKHAGLTMYLTGVRHFYH